MTYKKLIEKSKKLEKQLIAVKKELKKFPEGNFFCCRNGKYDKWYIRKNKKQIYLPKKESATAQQFAYKRYLSDLAYDLTCEKNGIDAYLNHYNSDIRKSDQLLLNPAYQNLLSAYFQPANQELLKWIQTPYESNPKNPEKLIHKTASGNMVRSKSETLIDMALYKYHIPFRYEAPLKLGQLVIYPDFTIRHPKTGEFYYWEHFGMMDNPSYIQKTFHKLELYTSNGLIPFQHIILTFETQNYPLDSQWIEKIIEYYFV